jgi:hypothetical protein
VILDFLANRGQTVTHADFSEVSDRPASCADWVYRDVGDKVV